MGTSVNATLTRARKLKKSGDVPSATLLVEELLSRFPHNPRLRDMLANLKELPAETGNRFDFLMEKGIAQYEVEAMEEARESFRAALRLRPNDAEVLHNIGSTELSLGNIDAAKESFHAAILADPGFAQPYSALSNLLKAAPDPAWLGLLQAALKRAEALPDKVMLAFALGQSLERADDTENAFSAFELGNALQRSVLGRSPQEKIEDLCKFSRPCFAAPAPVGPLSDWGDIPKPIFIVGLPRSGSTLTETILSRHSGVEAGGERPILAQAINAAGGYGGWPNRDQAQTIRDLYRYSLRSFAPETRWVTDKMPSNARVIGLIRLILPEARIIETHRDLRAVAWSLYRTHFSGSPPMNPFAYSFDDLAAYIAAHEAMMGLWHHHFGDAIVPLHYEALTEDPETRIRDLLAALEVEFEPGCLSPQDAKRSVRTASISQVRAPIYRGSSEAWRKYQRQLKPLTDRLEAIVRPGQDRPAA